jgi:hypothetical protein
MVWIVEWTQPGQSSVKVTAFDTEEYALVATCASLMQRVRSDWDLTNSDYQARAYLISDACASLNWKEAIRLFNEWEGDGDYEYMHQYRVYSRTPVTQLPVVHLLRSLPATAIPAQPIVAVPWKASKPGATCRGPCKQVSTDAYADQPDGTFCCYQCKYMSQVFGKKVP